MQLQQLSSIIANAPLLAALPLDQLLRFYDAISWLKDDIFSGELSYITQPPDRLPHNIQDFLATALALDPDLVALLWDSFKDLVAKDITVDKGALERRAKALIPEFLKYGLAYDIGEPSASRWLNIELTVSRSVLPLSSTCSHMPERRVHSTSTRTARTRASQAPDSPRDRVHA